MNISSLLRRYKISLLLEDFEFGDLEKEIIEILNRECKKHFNNSNSVIRRINNPLFKLGLYDKISNVIIHTKDYNEVDIMKLVVEWCEYYKID